MAQRRGHHLNCKMMAPGILAEAKRLFVSQKGHIKGLKAALR